MSTQWQQQRVTLRCKDGQGDTVDACVFGALAVHRTTCIPWTRARWSITHVPTGLHVSTANSERFARRFVREVAPLVDWTARTDLRDLPSEFWTAMDVAMLRAHDGQYVSEVRM